MSDVAQIRTEQDADRKPDNVLESIDFCNSNPYYVTETSLSYQAAMARTLGQIKRCSAEFS